MKKRFCLILAVMIMLLPCIALAASAGTLSLGDSSAEVSQMQTRLRALGYFNYRTTGKFSDMTLKALQYFQQQNGLEATGDLDGSTSELLYSTHAKLAPQSSRFSTVHGAIVKNPTVYGTVSSWEEIDSVFTVGTQGTLRDLYSDAAFVIQRVGGKNNALITPATAADAEAFIAMCGGESTWEKRPVLLELNGTLYAAAIFCSLNHGSDAQDAPLGTTHLYFSGSTSDLFGIADTEMDTSVLKAAGEII